jgi:hypothetical protein
MQDLSTNFLAVAEKKKTKIIRDYIIIPFSVRRPLLVNRLCTNLFIFQRMVFA